MLPVHGKKECTRYFSEIHRWNVSPNVPKPGYTALYSNNQVKEVEKRCIHVELRAYGKLTGQDCFSDLQSKNWFDLQFLYLKFSSDKL